MALSTPLAQARLERALQAIHARPEDGHDLEALAETLGASKFHSHRLFKAQFGQTPRRLVEAIRLERAANELVLYDRSIVDIAVGVGYTNHETFSRAFRRHFNVTPRAFRSRGQLVARRPMSNRQAVTGDVSFELSPVRLQVLRGLPMLTVTHVGPYHLAPSSLYEELANLAKEIELAPGRFVGMGLDPPGPQARFQAGLTLAPTIGERRRLDRYLSRQDRFSLGELPDGLHAMASHVGHYETLYHAIAAVTGGVADLPDVELVGLPVIEIYHSHRIKSEDPFNQTDVYIPVTAVRAHVP